MHNSNMLIKHMRYSVTHHSTFTSFRALRPLLDQQGESGALPTRSIPEWVQLGVCETEFLSTHADII